MLIFVSSLRKFHSSRGCAMAKILHYLTIVAVVLTTVNFCDGSSRWRIFLSKQNFTLSSSKDGRVAGGYEAARNQFPYLAIFFNALNDQTESACGGSIISSSWVLSAAHCFIGIQYTDLLAGIHDVTIELPLYEFQAWPTDITLHSSFNTPPRSNDIALVSTKRSPIPFSLAIQPVNLVPRSYANVDLTGSTARVAGWGITNDKGEMSPVPRFIDSSIISNQACSATYGNLILNSNFCLSGAGGKSTCSGDSGGGATILIGSTRYLIGIVSFGSELGCQLGYPTVKTRITSYFDWISTKAGIIIT